MEKRIYTLTDINEDLIRCVDRYLKKVMQEIRIEFFQSLPILHRKLMNMFSSND